MRKFLIAILVCFSVICLAAMTACSDGGDSGSDIGNNSASKSEIISETTSETVSETETADESESETTDESQSESQSENEPEVPVEVGYKIEVYAETLDGTFVKTALDKTGTAGDTVVITAAILQAANVIPKGYNFDETDERNVLSGTLEENKSLSLTVYLKLKEYEVVFKNEDGTVLQSGKVKHGATPSYSGTPEKEADKTYTYEFKSWDKEIVVCEEHATYTAVYTAKYIDYTITFDFANGEDALTTNYHYGDPVTVPANPTKEGYTFLGWDKEIAATCDGNATYTAGYAENVEYTVKHVKKSVFGYSEVMETEQKSGHKQTDVTTFKKEYDDLVYIDYSLGDTETVVEFYYGADGITYNTPNFTATGFDDAGSYTEKGKVTDGDRVYDNVYEASVTAGTGTAMLNIAYGDNVGKYLFLPIKQNYNYVGGDLQFIDGKGVYHNANDYPLWFDKNGNAIVYSTSNTDWMVMAVLLTEADYPKDGALNLNLFLWRLGTVQIGEYSFVSQDDFNAMFSVTYNTVNHYLRNIDGSFTLVETENNVTCIGHPTAKNYSAHVYSTATVIDGVCNMFYEYEEITFNTPNFAATGFDRVGGYVEKGTIEDGTSIRYNVYEATVNSGAGEARLNIAYGNNTGKWLLLPIKQTYSLVNSALQFIDGNGGWHTDDNYPTWFDINGATITYDSSYTGWKIMAVYLDSTSFPANGALNVNFFLWNLGAVQIGEYAFVTQEQLNLLGYYSGSETSDIQVNGWVAPESYSDDMLEKSRRRA